MSWIIGRCGTTIVNWIVSHSFFTRDSIKVWNWNTLNGTLIQKHKTSFGSHIVRRSSNIAYHFGSYRNLIKMLSIQLLSFEFGTAANINYFFIYDFICICSMAYAQAIAFKDQKFGIRMRTEIMNFWVLLFFLQQNLLFQMENQSQIPMYQKLNEFRSLKLNWT